MARTRVRYRRLLGAFALVTGLVLGAGRLLAGPASASSGPERHVVRAGDTLWEIAAARVGHGADPRPLVHEIRVANGLGSSELQVGSVLVVPAA